MDWKTFSFDYFLDYGQETIQRLVMIEAYKEAALNLVLPPDWSEKLDSLNRIRAVYGTTALEGNPLSEAEVSEQMEILDGRNPEPAKVTREQRQIRNAGTAQSWIRERFKPDTPPMEISDILHMHKLITEESDTTDNVPGSFRTFEVTVGSPDAGGVHRGAPAADVSRLMQDYVGFVNSRESGALHPVVRALLAHFFLVTIHPFGDGNGRVSRLVEAGLLFQRDYNVHGFYGLSNYFYRNERTYKMKLQESRRRQRPLDLTPFVSFGLSGFAEELKGINNFIKTKLNRLVYRSMMFRAHQRRSGSRRRLLNQRELQLLDFLLVQTEPADPFSESPSRKIKIAELTETPYVQAAYRGVTQRTFVRELVRLKEMGFINFTRYEAVKDWIVEPDFKAVGRY